MAVYEIFKVVSVEVAEAQESLEPVEIDGETFYRKTEVTTTVIKDTLQPVDTFDEEKAKDTLAGRIINLNAKGGNHVAILAT